MERNANISAVTAAIEGLLRGELPGVLPPYADDPELAALSAAVQRLGGALGDAREFLSALASGNLDVSPPPRNHLIAPFKQFHANLCHLTWQTQQIAAGDYQQSVDFLGDFSTAFNCMIAALKDRERLERAIHESEQQFRSLVGLSPEAICIHRDLTFVFTNDAALRLFGTNCPEDLLGRPWLDFVHPDYRDLVRERASSMNRDPELCLPTAEIRIIRLDGRLLDVDISTAYFPYRGQPAIQTLIRDISARKLSEEQLRYLSTHDALTDLYNRAFLTADLFRLERGRRFPVSIIMGDLDGLKTVNDTLGHEAGDRLLKQAAKVLQQGVRTDDVVARIGGDEFVILLPTADAAVADKVVSRIRAAESAVNCTLHEFQIGFSFGVATAQERGVVLEEVMMMADKRMYADKARRKGVAA